MCWAMSTPFNVAGRMPSGRIMLAAHLDEIGLVVTKVVEGFLHVGRIGWVDPRIVLGQEVVVYASGPGSDTYPNGLRGYIGERPPHLRDAQQNAAPPLRDLRVDLGLSSERLARGLVRVGDPVVVQGPYVELLEERVATKALDNRAGVAAMLGALGYLRVAPHDWDVIAVATVQEETGLRGATTGAFNVAPDLAIVIDVTHGATPGIDEIKTVEMDSGPALGWGPNFHPGLLQRIRDVAAALEISNVTDFLSGHSGTDAWAIQVAREGIPTALISIPVRYMHSPVEQAVLADLDRAARLIAAFVTDLGTDFMAELAQE